MTKKVINFSTIDKWFEQSGHRTQGEWHEFKELLIEEEEKDE